MSTWLSFSEFSFTSALFFYQAVVKQMQKRANKHMEHLKESMLKDTASPRMDTVSPKRDKPHQR